MTVYFIEGTRSRGFLRGFDFSLLAAVLLITAFGLVVLSSAVKSLNPAGYLLKQLSGIGVGLTLALLLSFVDYRYIKNIGFIFYWCTIALLVIVLFIGYGSEQWGARSWIDLGFISFQPSEFAKIGFTLVMADYLAEMAEKGITLERLGLTAFYALLPMGLILLQPDAGTLMVYAFMLAFLIFVAGIRYKYILYGGLAFMCLSPFLWLFVLGDHQKQRILSFIFPGSDPSNSTYQVDWAKMAVGSGKLTGQGLYNGILTQNNTVPIKESDFIFSVIGEEMGFIGALLLLALVFFLLLKCIRIARHASDAYGTFVATAIAAMFGFHYIENIGMNIGVLPVTGIPMPFVSYGGTAMISNFMAIGLLLSISMRQSRQLKSG